MKPETIINRFPQDLEEFLNYLITTDDEQKNIDTIGFTIHPLDKNGKRDYRDEVNKKEIINQPTYLRWDWTADESLQWSAFRNEYQELYNKYKANRQDNDVKKQLEDFISSCVAYDHQHQLLQRVANSGYVNVYMKEMFRIRPDVLQYETPLRRISINYEAQQPLDKLEKAYIKKLLTLHDHTYRMLQRIIKFRENMVELRKIFPSLWEQMPVLKDKADLATNKVFLPSPNFKGAMPQVVSYYVPSAEESQQRADDFNKSFMSFYHQIADMCTQCDPLYKESTWVLDICNEEDDKYTQKLFEEVDDLKTKVMENWTTSLDMGSVYEDYDNFLGEGWAQVKEESDKATEDWEKLVEEQTLLVGVYSNFSTFLQESFNPSEEEPSEVVDINNLPGDNEMDELRAETINRYKSNLDNNTNTYFDVEDWHMILDDFKNKYDDKNTEIALQTALSQHPEHPVLLTRLARQVADKLDFQKALEIIKQVEQQGPEQHPNLPYIKANIYLELNAPDLAIPIYKKLAAQKGEELKWWRTNSYDNLIDIYDQQKNYEECIRLIKETWAERPEEDHLPANLGLYYSNLNKQDEAEKVVKDYLETHPKSSSCWERLGHIYAETKQFDKAIDSFDHFFVIDKEENYEALFYKGKVLMELGKYQEAIKCFELCLLYFKLEKKYHLHAAQCYKKLNIQSQELYHYRRALAIDPESKEALDALQITSQLQ